jgi:hypothetical protein
VPSLVGMGLSRAQTQAFSNAGIQSLDHKDREIESGGGVHEADDQDNARQRAAAVAQPRAARLGCASSTPPPVHARTHPHTYISIYTHMRACMHACMHARIHTYIRTFVHT